MSDWAVSGCSVECHQILRCSEYMKMTKKLRERLRREVILIISAVLGLHEKNYEMKKLWNLIAKIHEKLLRISFYICSGCNILRLDFFYFWRSVSFVLFFDDIKHSWNLKPSKLKFEICTDSAVRGSLHFPLKIRTKSAVRGSLHYLTLESIWLISLSLVPYYRGPIIINMTHHALLVPWIWQYFMRNKFDTRSPPSPLHFLYGYV